MSAVFDLFKRAKGEDISKLSSHDQQLRLNKCVQCPLYGKYAKGVCGLKFVEGCGCIIKDKITYKSESCPNGEW